MSAQLNNHFQELSSGKFQFIDAGCSWGGSLAYCANRFKSSPGVGIDWSDYKVKEARAKGFSVIRANLVDEELPKRCVRFASMMDFLEHLPDPSTAVRIMQNLADASREFVFIRHPSFDYIEYLAEFGLKITWTDWVGHSNMMKIGDYQKFFKILGWNDYVIIPRMRIADSSHKAVVPIGAPTDTKEYDEKLHGPKPLIHFDTPVYGQYDIFIRLDSRISANDWDALISPSRESA